MATTVRFSETLSNAAWTARSLCESSAAVASSSTRMRGCLTTARARAIRCFCPPESCAPAAPTRAK